MLFFLAKSPFFHKEIGGKKFSANSTNSAHCLLVNIMTKKKAQVCIRGQNYVRKKNHSSFSSCLLSGQLLQCWSAFGQSGHFCFRSSALAELAM